MNRPTRPLKRESDQRQQVEPDARGVVASQHLILEALPAATLITRPDGSIVYTNRRFEDQFGTETLRTDRNIAGFYDDPREQQSVLETVMEKGYVEDHEVRVRNADGSLSWVLLSARRFRFAGEEVILATLFDITERKQLGDELRESEERFARLSAAASEGIGISINEKIVDANPQLARMLGYDTADELVGLNVMGFVASGSRELVAAKAEEEVAGPYEHLAVKKDGTPFPVEIRARSIPYKGRQARVTIIRDISEQRRREEELRESLALVNIARTLAETERLGLKNILQMIVASVNNLIPNAEQTVIHLLDQDGQILTPEAVSGFDSPPSTMLYMHPGKGVAGQVLASGETLYIEDVKTDPRFLPAGKPPAYRSLIVAPVQSGTQKLGTISVQNRVPNAFTRDESLLLSALGIQAANACLLEQTKKSLKETRALYRINRSLVASMDPDQLMGEIVELLQESFGYVYVQIFVADPETDDFIMHAGSGEVGRRLKSQGHRLAAGEGIVGVTAETGAPFFTNNVDEVVSFVRTPFLDNAKSELAVPIKVGSQTLGLLDIHQAPPALLTQRDVQLVSAVADQLAMAMQKANLYTDLQNSLRQEKATRSQLIHSERLTVAGRLLASVSHELNNPLQAIQNALFLLKEERGISPQGKGDLDIVLSETERMTALLERLRTTYRPVHAEAIQPVQINDIIEDVYALVATHLRHNHISFEFGPDPLLPAIPGMADQLRQVILNLFINAVDSMPAGGHLIVSSHLFAESREVSITVTDTGAGIDPAILPSVFDAFVTNKERGTGLGLAISYEIVLKHRGRIQAVNNPDRGATFSVWLPLEMETPNDPQRKNPDH